MAKKLQILRGTTAQNDAYTGSIGELTMDTEKVEVRIHDGTTQGGKTIGSGGSASLPILTHVFSDHKVNDMSWLNADTFSWQSGDVYKAAYEHLASEMHTENLYAWEEEEGRNRYTRSATPSVGDPVYTAAGSQISTVESVGTDYIVFNGTTCPRNSGGDILGTNAETDTVDDITITFYRAEDGHKICLADQETNVQRLYDATGIAWYYILDTENKQFKLPRTKHAFTGLRDIVGGYVEAGLPNITGGIYNVLGESHKADGAFSIASTWTHDLNATASGAVESGANCYFDASSSSSVYGNSDTVQPKATQMYLYFYVGNYTKSAIEQTAGITSEQLNNKIDKSEENRLNPAGVVTAFAGTTPPTGWLKCDGSAISRERYAALFAVIGTTYGAGDGSTTFNLPTQSVLPLGTTAPIKLKQAANGAVNRQYILNIENGYHINTWSPGNEYSSGIVSKQDATDSRNGVLQNETSDNVFTKVALNLNGSHYTDLANATGAQAIVCIKY